MKDQKQKNLVAKIRSVIRQGNTFYISLPKEFVEKHGIQKGDKLPVLADHIMKVVPMKEE